MQNGANSVTQIVNLPQQSQLLDFLIDTTTTWNSGTSDTLSIGTAAAGTQYASGIPVGVGLTSARQRPTFTAAELLAMENIGTNTAVYITVTPVGTAATAGTTLVSVIYLLQVNLTGGAA
jgi:hypothetical protein